MRFLRTLIAVTVAGVVATLTLTATPAQAQVTVPLGTYSVTGAINGTLRISTFPGAPANLADFTDTAGTAYPQGASAGFVVLFGNVRLDFDSENPPGTYQVTTYVNNAVVGPSTAVRIG